MKPSDKASYTQSADCPISTNWTSNNPSLKVAYRDEFDEDSSSQAERVSPQDWAQAQDAVRRGNRDVIGVIETAVRKSDVLVIGESHTDEDPVRRNAAKLINAAYQGGARILYVELPSQAQVDQFMKTGEHSFLPEPVSDQPGYVAMLNEARRLGIRVIAVDTAVTSAGTEKDVRDATMAQNISGTLPRGGKAVFWVGGLHATSVVQFGATEKRHHFQSAATLLRKYGLSLTTVLGVGRDGAISGSAESMLRSQVPVFVDPRDFPESIQKLDPRLPPGGEDQYSSSPLGSTPFTAPIYGVDLTLHH